MNPNVFVLAYDLFADRDRGRDRDFKVSQFGWALAIFNIAANPVDATFRCFGVGIESVPAIAVPRRAPRAMTALSSHMDRRGGGFFSGRVGGAGPAGRERFLVWGGFSFPSLLIVSALSLF